ncbi:S8 family peptidase [Bifidobacterium sp. ESL0728]|uniref:S8 family peptidase n=1 Tax=Bifidobacterium sp. ESL0728 TaxID=2983220 RepID=UPI0023F9E51C|nr:S8 family peptidase [Bifidobacterium sp. ESL0728]WEV59159.1 S8 family peptidase [Bifidobacterium sp. ESL0728]
MNNILRLKGTLHRGNGSAPGPAHLPAHEKVTADEILQKKRQLLSVLKFWQAQRINIDPLVEVHYRTVVAKSNRIKKLLSYPNHLASTSIVGATFEGPEENPNHVITYCVPLTAIESTIIDLQRCADTLNVYGKEITATELSEITKNGLSTSASRFGLSKSSFAQIICDVHAINRFDVKSEAPENSHSSLVTIYDTKKETVQLLNELGLDIIDANLLDKTTINLRPDQYDILRAKAPYLVAMSLQDITEFKFEKSTNGQRSTLEIPEPKNEPIIGVIDTCFDKTVYFKNWVEYHDELNPEFDKNQRDYRHGTEVSSIIVDGPHLNPELDDGCGRFRVRHFAVATADKNSSFTIFKSIQRIVAQNQDIKVWNLSLGSIYEAPTNFISPEAALLDELQNRYDVIFVVAGTNKLPGDDPNRPKRIGSPADSINSIVVNSSSSLNEPASYTREGPVLQFFRKPDISCFGGDNSDRMAVYSPDGITTTAGTSFAAPWIARKMAFLIQTMGLSREIAKALLIDSASAWGSVNTNRTKLGYGIVPRKIQDILKTPANEIRFVIEGTAKTFETSNYRIPVPITDDKYQYTARATLCYFPKCSRQQGVDYTDTELDFHFGRVKKNGIDSLDQNVQGDPGAKVYEGSARQLYRKWDNVKHLSDVEKSRFIPRKILGQPYWGFKIRSTTRSDTQEKRDLRFGIVVTLKEMKGRNRIDEFIQTCQLQPEPWIVNEIDMNTGIELYQQSEAEIDFDEHDDETGDTD